MGQTSELDEEKSSVLVLSADATDKDADDISRGLYDGGRRTVTTTVV